MTQTELNDILIKFSRLGQSDKVREAIRQGADVHAEDDFALQRAAENGHLDVIKVLIENGADIHANDDAPVRYAVGNGHLNIIQSLIESDPVISNLVRALKDLVIRCDSAEGITNNGNIETMFAHSVLNIIEPGEW